MRPSAGFRSAWIIVATSAAALLLATLPAMADSEIAGRWTGEVQQSDGQTFTAIMEFDAAGRGRSDYPSLNCSGKLSGTGKKGTYRFRETIASSTGRAGESGRCIDGTISFTVSGDVMNWSWSGAWQGKPITAAGVLARDAPR
jgi:hypothetical protein